MSDRPAIEIYSIGTELLNGQIQDTNSFWMAQQIAALGGYVRRIAILDDDMDELTGVLKDACQRGTRVVITTGGLGPTPDDMTVEAIAKIIGVGTGVDETLVERYMESRGIEKRADVSEGLIKMATKPKGSTWPIPIRRAWLPAWSRRSVQPRFTAYPVRRVRSRRCSASR